MKYLMFKTIVTIMLIFSFAQSGRTMQLQQPEYMGEINMNVNMGGGHLFKDAAEINADRYIKNKRHEATPHYNAGYAKFGQAEEAEEAVYVHIYGGADSKRDFGDKTKKNVVPIGAGKLYRIKSDEGITFYCTLGLVEGDSFCLVGKNDDGSFLHYASGAEIYNAFNGHFGIPFPCMVKVKGDELSFDYVIIKPGKRVILKWNANRQNFVAREEQIK